MKEEEIVKAVLGVLNEAVSLDQEAVESVVGHRVSCNNHLANHETIPVFQNDYGELSFGAIGLLNGIMHELTGRTIAGVYEEDGRLVKFVELKEDEVNAV